MLLSFVFCGARCFPFPLEGLELDFFPTYSIGSSESSDVNTLRVKLDNSKRNDEGRTYEHHAWSNHAIPYECSPSASWDSVRILESWIAASDSWDWLCIVRQTHFNSSL